MMELPSPPPLYGEQRVSFFGIHDEQHFEIDKEQSWVPTSDAKSNTLFNRYVFPRFVSSGSSGLVVRVGRNEEPIFKGTEQIPPEHRDIPFYAIKLQEFDNSSKHPAYVELRIMWAIRKYMRQLLGHTIPSGPEVPYNHTVLYDWTLCQMNPALVLGEMVSEDQRAVVSQRLGKDFNRKQPYLCIVESYASEGDLMRYLTRVPATRATMNFVFCDAGMASLYGQVMGFMYGLLPLWCTHRDLKPDNVLVQRMPLKFNHRYYVYENVFGEGKHLYLPAQLSSNTVYQVTDFGSGCAVVEHSQRQETKHLGENCFHHPFADVYCFTITLLRCMAFVMRYTSITRHNRFGSLSGFRDMCKHIFNTITPAQQSPHVKVLRSWVKSSFPDRKLDMILQACEQEFRHYQTVIIPDTSINYSWHTFFTVHAKRLFAQYAHKPADFNPNNHIVMTIVRPPKVEMKPPPQMLTALPGPRIVPAVRNLAPIPEPQVLPQPQQAVAKAKASEPQRAVAYAVAAQSEVSVMPTLVAPTKLKQPVSQAKQSEQLYTDYPLSKYEGSKTLTIPSITKHCAVTVQSTGRACTARGLRGFAQRTHQQCAALLETARL